MSAGPWLSIVTVVRNDADALVRTIDSVQQQCTEGVEHLVLDGASTDGTTELAEQAAAQFDWVRTWSQPDGGVYDAMNRGIHRARGRWVHFLNAGDIYATAAELAWLSARLRGLEMPWLRTPVQFVDSAGAPTRPLHPAAIDVPRFLRGRQDVFHQGAVMRRQLLQDLGGFDEAYIVSADFDLMSRALARGLVPVTDERVMVHVDASGLSTVQWRRSLIEVHRIRSLGRGTGRTAASLVQTAARIGEVAVRRTGRRTAERLVGTRRVSQWRG